MSILPIDVADETSQFSADEVAQRASRLRVQLAEADLDALVAYDDGAKLGGGNVRYLGGFTLAPPPSPSYVVVGPTGPATIVVMESRAGTVASHAKSFCAPGISVIVGKNADWAGAIADALCQVGVTRGAVGTDALPAKDYALAEKLRALLPDLTFRAANKILEKVRRDKSPLELEFCRRASQISMHVFDLFKQVVQPGVPHEIAVAEAAHVAAREGGEELVLALGSGTPWIWSSATAARRPGRFEDGQPVSCEVNVRYRGYFSQVARTWPLGTVSPERQRKIDAVRSAHDQMIQAVQPGALPRDVFRAGLVEIRRHGLDYNGIRYGHGLGLTIGEGWDFADDDSNLTGTVLTPLSDTAYAVCHPFLFERDANGAVLFNALWGDPWTMSPNGAERLW